MKFKNELERRIFEITQKVCGATAVVEHNKVVQIENADSPEVISFVGPPKKEIDVITAQFAQSPGLKVLISCKDYGQSKAEPADIQEWAAVIRTMNKYANDAVYLGIVISPSGFTSGCEPWATSYNLGVIPPLKGKRLRFPLDTCSQMFERALTALERRIHFQHGDLFSAPHFYEFVYRLTEAFEGRDRSAQEFGNRYRLLQTGWLSSFQELVKTFKGKTLERIDVTSTGTYLTFAEGVSFRMTGSEIHFGRDDGQIDGDSIDSICEKNFYGEPCSFDFLKMLVIGHTVTSAGDWGDRFEFGLSDDLMLAIEPGRLQVYRTRNPMDQHLL